MMKVELRKKTILFFTAILLASVIAFVAILSVGGRRASATAAQDTAGYHVGAVIDVTNDAELYTDSVNTTKGTKGNGFRTADTPFIYKAVFAEDVADAWVVFNTRLSYASIYVEATNNISVADSWKPVLASTIVDGALVVPDDTNSMSTKTWDGEKSYFIDLSEFMASTGDSPVYVRFGKIAGSETLANNGATFVMQLKFFEGNAINKDSGAYAHVASKAILDGNGGFDDSSMFFNSGMLKNDAKIGVNGDALYFDGYTYAIWEFYVSADATNVGFEYRRNADNNPKISVYAGGKAVFSEVVVGWPAKLTDLSEELSDFIALDEGFKIQVVLSHPTYGGGGPQLGYFSFKYDIPAASSIDSLKPESVSGIVYGEKISSFNVQEKTYGNGEQPALAANAGDVTNNDNVAHLNGAYDGKNIYFDNTKIGIFKLTYPAGLTSGYIELNCLSTKGYQFALCNDEANWNQKKVMTNGLDGLNYANYFNFDILAQSTGNAAKTYIDVTDYLKPAGGTLYIKFSDYIIHDGDGPKPKEFALYAWKTDTTAFTAAYDNTTPVKKSEIADLVVDITSISTHETVSRVKVGTTTLDEDDWSVAEGKLTIKKSALVDLTVGTHTIEIISSYGVSRKATVNYTIVADAKTVTGITVKTNPTKTSYEAGEALAFAGGVIEVTYDDGTKAEINLTADGVTMSASKAQDKAGTQTINVNYEGKTATFNITVAASKDGGCGGVVGFGTLFGMLATVIVAAGAVIFRKKVANKK